MRTYIPEAEEYALDQPMHRSSKGVLLQRTKTVVAGDHLDADIYPVLDWQYSREAGKRGKTTEQMQRANFARAFRTFTQIGNLNFGEGDIFGTFTSAEGCSLEEFAKIKRRFFDRLRTKYRKAGVPLEYMGIVESTRQGQQHHIHMILRGGALTRDEVEKIWREGVANTRAVQVKFEDKGVEGLCRYMTQHKEGQEKLMKRKWFASKGLKKPRATYNDRKFSRRASQKIADAVREDAKREFEKRYPGWRLVDYTVHYSDFLPGVYVHAHMRRDTARAGG
ncbi:MAG: hypothetical protein IKH30_01615 [Clostridia bacterium]|nr:hypothetical protein [Clostridia bacterium]MBR4537228.1 hypothetical protein [Clostridia bacterium]